MTVLIVKPIGGRRLLASRRLQIKLLDAPRAGARECDQIVATYLHARRAIHCAKAYWAVRAVTRQLRSLSRTKYVRTTLVKRKSEEGQKRRRSCACILEPGCSNTKNTSRGYQGTRYPTLAAALHASATTYKEARDESFIALHIALSSAWFRNWDI